MNVFEAIKRRYSVRRYLDKDVEEDKLMRILEAARLAPSARNLQPWKFVIVRDKERRRELREAALNQHFVEEAPVVIAAVGLNPERQMRCGVPSYAVDVAIAVEHMALQAVEEGLGTCWIGAFEQDKVRKILKIPEKYKVVALLTLGYPAEPERPKIRKRLEEIIAWEEFTE